MEEQKILNNEQLSWYEDEDSRLDYQVVFEDENLAAARQEGKRASSGQKENVDVKELLRERDLMWKKRLHKAKENAYEKGIEEGKRKGIAEARREIDKKIEGIEHMLDQAHREWKQRQEAINPGLLDLIFDMVERIVGIPVENPAIRSNLEEELSTLLHETDKNVKPVLWICESDHGYVEELIAKYAPEITVSIRSTDKYNPGEFAFDTEKETVVYNFKEMLRDFRENISVPSWK